MYLNLGIIENYHNILAEILFLFFLY